MGPKVDPKGKKPYVNPVKCLNYEGGHRYEHVLHVNINVPAVDQLSGELKGELSKTYVLELVCQEHNCGSRITLHTKTVGMDENISLAQMLVEHKEKLAEAYYAEHPEQRPSVR